MIIDANTLNRGFPATPSVCHATKWLIDHLPSNNPKRDGQGNCDTHLRVLPVLVNKAEEAEFEMALYLARLALSGRLTSQIWRIEAKQHDENRAVIDVLETRHRGLIIINHAEVLHPILSALEKEQGSPLEKLPYRPLAIFRRDLASMFKAKREKEATQYFHPERYHARALEERNIEEQLTILNLAIQRTWNELVTEARTEIPQHFHVTGLKQKFFQSHVQGLLEGKISINDLFELARKSVYAAVANLDHTSNRLPPISPPHLLQAAALTEESLKEEALKALRTPRIRRENRVPKASNSSVPPPA